jgi:hypothetical protein
LIGNIFLTNDLILGESHRSFVTAFDLMAALADFIPFNGLLPYENSNSPQGYPCSVCVHNVRDDEL